MGAEHFNLDAELPLLARLRFVTRLRRRGGLWGERRSTRRGTGLEFADYRDYAPGDDPRRVDWNLYARLDRPYVRLYEEEEALTVALLLDGSASMGWVDEAAEASATSRWSTVKSLAMALGGLALVGGDSVRGALLCDERAAETWGPRRGAGFRDLWLAWLAALSPSHALSLGSALRDYAAQMIFPSLVLLLTDGYDVDGVRTGVAALAGRGHEVILLHVLTPQELAPSLSGDLRLVDVETQRERAVTLDRGALADYQSRLASWQGDLRALLGRYGGRYVLLRADAPLRKMLLEDLRQAGVLR